jgi:hypothetical protein
MFCTVRPAEIALSLVLASCGGAATPCDRQVSCEDGTACVAGRCLSPTSEPVAMETRRVVLSATAVRVLSSRGAHPRADVVTLGVARDGETRVLLSFDAELEPGTNVERAFLVLSADADSLGPSAEVELSAAPILSPWHGEAVSWGSSPSIGLALATEPVVGAPRRPLRFDVTRAFQGGERGRFGLAVIGRGADPVGVSIDARVGTTAGPRLELYLR